ncbi:transposable element Tcb2 transposase [Trichonephila clavipes]|nr:transposable element Tcb2 transposase [Trichonephila clavipes]
MDRGSLVLVPSSLNEIRYVEFLDDPLHPLMLFCYPHGNGVIRQDSYTFSNPGWLLTGVKGHNIATTNLTELWASLANIWQDIPVERFQKHVESMPRRVAAVIKA